MPLVTSLINKGKTADQVKGIIEKAEFIARLDDDTLFDDSTLGESIFDLSEGNYEGILFDFADKCYEIKNRQNNK